MMHNWSNFLYATAIVLASDLGAARSQSADQQRNWCSSQLLPSDRVIQICDDVIRREPNYLHAFSARGAAFYRKGEFDRAISDFDQALRLDPNNPYALFNRGLTYYHMGEFDRAIRDFDDTTRVDPTYFVAYRFRGLTYFAKGDYDRAVRDYDMAIKGSFDQGIAADRAEALRKRSEAR